MYGYIIPMDVIVALFLTINLGTARFQSVKYKALQVTPFLYIGSHFICPPYWWVLVLELLQSYKIILKYYKYLGEFFQKKYVCTRTRTHIVFIALRFA